MNAEIIAVGTEILLGDILNTNAQFLSQELAKLGIDVFYQTVVGDNPERLEDTIFKAFGRANLVITTGGLGPTEDDLTKETGAKFFRKDLVLDERAYKRIEKFFSGIGRTMTDNNKKQAFVPKGATVMYNENGTAPGIIIEETGKIMVMLPGPPKEAVPMFNSQVKPYLEARQEAVLISRSLRIAEVGESAMETMVKDLIDAQKNPTIAPYAKQTESLLRITARGETAADAKALIEPMAQEVYKRFGNAVYAEGETTMQETVAKLLISKKMTISSAESCTGGLLAARLIEYPGVSQVFMDGAVTYSNAAKMQRLNVKAETLEKYGAVSEETAREMAEGIAKSSKTDIGISTTGVAGPDGGSTEKPVGLVYIGLCINGKTEVKKLQTFGNRESVRERAVYSALNFLRLGLEGK